MELTEVEKYLDKLFKKESYRELSAVSKENCLEDSPVEEAYNFDEISEYIFSSNKPASADALLIKNDKIYLIEFKSGFERKISLYNFDRVKCNCEKIGDICDDYAELMKKHLENIERELKANLFQKAAESRWVLEYHLFPEVYKNNYKNVDKNDGAFNFPVQYIIVTDKVKDNPVDAMEQMLDDLGNIHNQDNFYERMEHSVQRLYCESRYGKKAFYEKVEVYAVQDFEEMFLAEK